MSEQSSKVYISRNEAASRLGVTSTTIYNYVRRGTVDRPPLPAIKLGPRTWRIRIEDFDSWVAAVIPGANNCTRGRPAGSKNRVASTA
jgi:DNA binding domain, excisionase family